MILGVTFGDVMSYVLYILIALLVLMIMILVHELGHYIAGKILGFGIVEFSIGFGPKIFQKQKKNGELITVRAIPLGGYCSFVGEDEQSNEKNAFHNKHPFKRIIVLVSGAFMNFVLALFIITIMFTFFGQTLLVVTDPIETPLVSSEYTFNKNDVLLKIEDSNIYMPTDIIIALENKTVAQTEIEPIKFTVLRNGKVEDVLVKLQHDGDFENLEDIGRLYSVLGIDSNGGIKQTRIRYGFFKSIGRSFEYSFRIGGTIFNIIHQLFTGQLGISAMGGTITTLSVTANAIKTSGFYYLLQISAFIGVNLAVFNLLPFPALDGCQVVFTIIEWIFKKPVNQKVQTIINLVGFVLLMCFAIFVDVQHLFT